MAPGGKRAEPPDMSRCQGADRLEGNGFAPDAIRAELERILRSELFACSERLSRFLRFAVEQALAGRAEDLKESVLAVEVFDRQATFDSHVSSIVRVEARRLRERLQRYYDGEGREAIIRIDLPKGRYSPAFRKVERPGTQPLEVVESPAAARENARQARRVIHVKPMIVVACAAVAAAAWLATSLEIPRRTISEPVVVRLTSDTGLTCQPTLSLASKLIAYTSDRAGDGRFDIWAQPIDGGRPSRLTDDQGNNTEPAFSPDGSTLAYRSDRDGGGIYLLSSLGGKSTLLTRGGLRPRFSPDGRLVAYWDGERSFRSARIFVISVAGGQPAQLVPGFQYAAYPVWSPDGHKVLFVGISRAGEQWDWWLTPINGGAPVRTGIREVFARQELESPDRGWGSVPRFAPGGWTQNGHVVFSARSGRYTNLWRIRLSPKDGRPAGEAERLTSGAGCEDHVSVAGEWVVFSVIAKKSDIWRMTLDENTGEPTGVPVRLTNNAAANVWPQVSSDGRTLVFLSDRDGNYDVFVRNMLTGEDKPLTSTRQDEFCALISMDGLQVAFQRSGQPKPSIYVVPVSGGEAKVVCEDCGEPRTWSPDNRILLYQNGASSHSRIGMLERPGMGTQWLGDPEQSFYSPRFSPDGRWIAFVARTPPERHRLVIVPFRKQAAGSRHEWISLEGSGYWVDKPRWSPDGNLLYFLSDRDGSVCVWAQRLSATDKRPSGEPFPVWHMHATRDSLASTVGRELAVARGSVFLSLAHSLGNVSMMTRSGRD